MCRTVKSSLVGFIGFATLVAPVVGQDAPLAYLDAADDSLFQVKQSAANAMVVSDAGVTDDVKAIVPHKQPISKVEFKIEKRAISKYDEPSAFVEPEFWCGLIYDGDMFNVKVGDGEPLSDKAFTPEEDAAQKVTDAFESFFPEDAERPVVVTRVKNTVTVEFVGAETADIVRGVTFGGPSLKYKVSVAIFTTKSFADGVGKYKIDPSGDQTGGPLGWPVEPTKPVFDAPIDSLESSSGK